MICTQEDSYTSERYPWHARWLAYLNDGIRVIDDSFRHGPMDNAWLRLKTHCNSNSLYIVKLELQYGSHLEQIEPSDAYTLTFGASADWADRQTYEHFVVGVLREDLDNHCFTYVKQWWKLPELIMLREVNNEMSELESHPCLIRCRASN